MKYVLGIDQGGSKTHAAIADLQGNILGVGLAPGGYHAITGMDYAMERVQEAAAAAAAQTGVSLEEVAAVGAGMTGADFDYEYGLLHTALQQRYPSARVRVTNDCMIALRGGTQCQNAAIICAGTGLNCGVRRADGAEFVLGYYIDDNWQGGAALGKQTMVAVFEADIGMRPPTLLTARMLEKFGLDSVDALMQAWVGKTLPRDGLKHFVQDLDQCAAENDEVALAILSGFGKACARYALAGIRRMNLDAHGLEVVLSGSVFKSKTPTLGDTIAAQIHRYYPHATICNARYEPVVGGVLLALELQETPVRLMDLEPSAKKMQLLRN